MKYKCIKSFSIPECDADGFETEKYCYIKEDTVWERDDDASILGGDVHLDNDLSWLEISDETLQSNFELIEQEEQP